MIFWEIRLIFMRISHGFVYFFATLIHIRIRVARNYTDPDFKHRDKMQTPISSSYLSIFECKYLELQLQLVQERKIYTGNPINRNYAFGGVYFIL